MTEGPASTTVRDHPFEPKRDDEPWGLCKHCNLSEPSHVSSRRPYVPTSPPARPPDPPPNGRLLDQGEPSSNGRPEPLPVVEIDLSEMQEHLPQKKNMLCMRCNTVEGRELPNGAILCAACEDILKP